MKPGSLLMSGELFSKTSCSILLASALSIHAIIGAAQNDQLFRLTSPDGRIEVSIGLPSPASPDLPRWSAAFRGKSVLSDCRLRLQTKDAGELTAGVKLLHEEERSVDQRIEVLFGKSDHAKNAFHERQFHLETPRHRHVNLFFRCYNDAIALRYELPGSSKTEPVVITEEATSFGVEGNPAAYAQYLENFTTSHEHNVTAVQAGELPVGQLLDMPLTLLWADGTCAAITEAALRHYAGMSLQRTDGTNGVKLVSRLTPRPDGAKVVRPLPLQTPWRVVLIGDRPGALLESSTLYCLNDPSVIGNASWIKPGKITFSWWNGDVYDGHRDLPILSFDMARKYIDFCARAGIPTHSLTSDEKTVSPWYFQSAVGVAPGPDTDVTRTRSDFDLPTIRKYAQSKHVRLWTWVHQGALRGRVEEAFSAFEKMGWSGMMVDFFDHDDQDSVEHAESILQAAAKHHLLIHFHGVWKPTGWQRTYPNLMNHESALNFEYLKWSDRCPPEHNLNMAFTRLIAGPMDYHLGGFRAVTRHDFQPHNIAPNVMGTRCHQLGLYVCYDNPNPMVADYPVAYEGQPGFEFLQAVPTWWNETRVLVAKIGELLVTARRSGKTWYIGGISAGPARDLEVPLAFLQPTPYTAKLWEDAGDAAADPNHLTVKTTSTSAGDSLRIHVSQDGGFVAQITPNR
ncbi:MAG TPA: glycoside hydrolase family 97 protein [Patescibacteria group bacterium]|nr:glycoside hydrolase family 97 protein [Patescibacteria group bacterium]